MTFGSTGNVYFCVLSRSVVKWHMMWVVHYKYKLCTATQLVILVHPDHNNLENNRYAFQHSHVSHPCFFLPAKLSDRDEWIWIKWSTQTDRCIQMHQITLLVWWREKYINAVGWKYSLWIDSVMWGQLPRGTASSHSTARGFMHCLKLVWVGWRCQPAALWKGHAVWTREPNVCRCGGFLQFKRKKTQLSFGINVPWGLRVLAQQFLVELWNIIGQTDDNFHVGKS